MYFSNKIFHVNSTFSVALLFNWQLNKYFKTMKEEAGEQKFCWKLLHSSISPSIQLIMCFSNTVGKKKRIFFASLY